MQLETSSQEDSRIPRTRRLPSASRELVLLAPSGAAAPKFFNHLQIDPERHGKLLAEAQRLRGSVYLKDGAITPAQLTDGRHHLDTDAGSWHLLVLDQERRVCGCSRYREYSSDSDFAKLGVSNSALARCAEWGARLASAVKAELALVRRLGLSYVELGGWALREQIRKTSEALRMALTTYSLAQALGCGVGLSTVTRRNGSASILKRIGARPLEHENSELPSYHDPQYRCEMEILRFYFWAPNPRYAPWIAEIRAELPAIRVITDGLAKPAWNFMKLKSAFNSDLSWHRPPQTAAHRCVTHAALQNLVLTEAQALSSGAAL